MASKVKKKETIKAQTFGDDGRQLNIYFPVSFEVIFAQISIMYVIPSEPADQRKERQSIFKISSLTLTFRHRLWRIKKRPCSVD